MNQQLNFKRWNNLSGLIVFLLSAFIYLFTLEPTASFWDCGEFISCSYKLEICHAPGNPFFLLIGRLASMAALGDTSKVAIAINASSGICSALTIMFLFWTITWFCRKLKTSGYEQSNTQKLVILVAGFIGSMAYAVSDSFWFSAVEAEVYAMSSMFTALVFWCILKWEESDSVSSDRWLLLIAYLFGLSIGVHLLNLLAIPAIVAIYYFKNYKVTWRNSLLAFGIALLMLFVLLVIIIPGIPTFLAQVELIAVNSFGMHYNAGYAIGIPLIAVTIGVALYFSYRKKCVWAYRSFLMLALVILGFSTYGVIVIRSNDNPAVDMNNPEDPFALTNYLNRENYGKRPLFYGPSYVSSITGIKERNSYERSNGKYVSMPLIPDYEYDPNTLMFFPRMSSSDPGHANAYKQWIHFEGKPYAQMGANGQTEQILLPTFSDNLAFFFKYQLGYMYLRYFMWNFAGKQSDVQGHGNVLNGNWLSGIPFIDRARLGAQDKLPTSAKNNPGRNIYFMLPLLLGLIGLYFHFKTDKQNFAVLALLFFFSGIAVIIYLNEIPSTPRERDYVHVGSFYVFAIWIGIGVLALFEQIKKHASKLALPLTTAATLSVPLIMISQNWDDHDRSLRYHVLEYARNYLESCKPNAILFTSADNDTYPFWYAQEVEGIRRDVQVVLMPYLSANWYVNQMRQPAYQRQGLKMSIPQEKYAEGQRSTLPIIERIDTMVDASQMLDFVASDDARTKVNLQGEKPSNYIPSHRINIPVTKQAICDGDSIMKPVNSILISLKGNYISMDKLVLLDILTSNQWKRPVYFTSPQAVEGMGLENYLKLDGLAYRLTPYKTPAQEYTDAGYIRTNQLYDQYMNQFSWASLSDPRVYLDNTHVYTTNTSMLRCKFTRLAETLLAEQKTTKAVAILDQIVKMLPNEKIPYDYYNLVAATLYFQAGQHAKGTTQLNILKRATTENMQYFQSLSSVQRSTLDYEYRLNQYLLQSIGQIEKQFGI